MRSLGQALRWLLHPLFLAVLLVGVAGVLFGMIIAVQRQEGAVVTPTVAPPASESPVEARIAELETALAERGAALSARESELAELQNQMAALRADAPSAAELADAESRITTLEASLVESSEELDALRGETIDLAGQLAEAIQARDELRDQVEQVRRAADSERTDLEQTIADLRRRLATVEQQAAVAARQAEEAEAARSAEVPSEPRDEEPPSVRSQPAGGPISQGVAAYQAGDYRKAYELWLPPALAGESRAQFYVGALYFEGRGVEQDIVRSYMWLRAATESDDLGARKLLDRVSENMSGADLAEAESRIADGQTIPDR